MPCRQWEEVRLILFLKDPSLSDPLAYLGYRQSKSPHFFFTHTDRPKFESMLSQWDGGDASPVERADRLLNGRLVYFSQTDKEVGFPPDWHRNAFTGETAPAHTHWSRIPDFGFGDIKVIWEPSRFGFVYDLVRAYWRTGDERYAEAFWRLVEGWREKNPPNCGANWKCGQEIAFRVMAWCFGLYGLMGAAATHADRVAALGQMMAVSGERIEGNIGYALSQRNNHGISEAVGLWTIGLLFPELCRAERWREKGRRYLEEQARSLIYEDGAFSQHSVNYHRLMLHDYLWALRLGDLNGQSLSDGLKERVKKAGEFVYQLQDAETGQVPCYGPNDGALILPLNHCDYLDFRPVVQAVHCYFSGERLFDNGPWDEDLLWLFGPEALSAPIKESKKRDLQAREGGYYTLRSETGFALVRCAEFKDRPGHADMLHVDLWWRGQNIAIDPGTYSYNAPAPWNNPLAHTAYHNTVTVDGHDQMKRVSRFIWLPWLTSTVRCDQQVSAKGFLTYWEGEHNGYCRLSAPVTHRRGILRIGEEAWLVLDSLISEGAHNYRLHWLLPDEDYEWDEGSGLVSLHTSVGDYFIRTMAKDGEGSHALIRKDPFTPQGWRAPYYNYREPAISLELSGRGRNFLFLTVFAPQECRLDMHDGGVEIGAANWSLGAVLEQAPLKPTLVNSVVFNGNTQDRLSINK